MKIRINEIKKDSKETEALENAEGEKKAEIQDAEESDKKKAEGEVGKDVSAEGLAEKEEKTEEKAEVTKNKDADMEEAGLEQDTKVQDDAQETKNINGEKEAASAKENAEAAAEVTQNENVEETVENVLQNDESAHKQENPSADTVGENGRAQKEEANRSAPEGDGEVKEKQDTLENDEKSNVQDSREGKSMEGEMIENGKVEKMTQTDASQHPASVSC